MTTTAFELDPEAAIRLARRALVNLAREYPNQPQYLLESDADLVPPREAHPVFFGCFDWHSAVHTHWALMRLLAARSVEPLRVEIEAALDRAFTDDKVAVEARYLARHPAFERPYGLAWLMLLVAEAATTRWRRALVPLAAAGRANVVRWLGMLRYAVRSGTHNQTAFALLLLHDAANALHDRELESEVCRHALDLYGNDVGAPLALEPSGDDFLSPALAEADLMCRVLPAGNRASWLTQFLPGIPLDAAQSWLGCGEVVDEADGKAVHLHGLNLSRAANLRNIAAALPAADARRAALQAAAERHAAAGVRAALAGCHYAGDHWLPSFAVYLLTDRPWRAAGGAP